MASWDGNEWDHRCLGCGALVADVLWRVGSVLCHDCRDLRRSVDPVLLEQWAEARRLAAKRAADARRDDRTAA
ncbi:MAG: hypothetical protein ICV74_00145 [Thermoleophilia bacterium]|nr:hypothetical protein [Thermoleophilia bacterium]